MNTRSSLVRLYIYPPLLALWLVVTTALLAWLDISGIVLVMALLVFTAVFALTNLFRFSGWLAAVVSIIVNSFVVLNLRGGSATSYLLAGIFAIAALGVAGLSAFIIRQFGLLSDRLDRDRKMINALAMIDPDTNLLTGHYADRSLKAEIIRCQRFNRGLCVMVMEVANWDALARDLDEDSLREIKKQLASILLGAIRLMDIAFYSDKLGAILPETTPEGALVVARRLTSAATRQARVPVHVGISCFPSDAVSSEDLMQAAEAALKASLAGGQTVLFYSQITTQDTSTVKEQEDVPQSQEAEVVEELLNGAKTKVLGNAAEPSSPVLPGVEHPPGE